MTVASATPTKDTYTGNGTTVYFPFTFPIATTDGSDVFVYLTDPTTGLSTLLTSNYSVDVEGAQVLYPIVTDPPLPKLPLLWKITIIRIENITQLMDLLNQGSMNAETLETAFDKLTFICQQIQEQISRAVLQNVTQTSQLTMSPTTQSIADAALQAAGQAATSASEAAASAATLGDLLKISIGLDASKSALPVVGDVHLAYDTQTIYFCNELGVWTSTAVNTEVIAPPTNSANYVPQWDGANSRTLKNGLAVGTGANNLVQLDALAKLPAVDGSALTGIVTLPSQTGNNGKFLTTNGTAASWGIPFMNVQVFTSSGTFTKPVGIDKVLSLIHI